MLFDRKDFPADFVFGAATSAYQIEGHAQGGAGRTHWDDFAETPGNVVGAQTGARAIDHLNRMDEDLDLVAGAGLDAYRFSVSWARVLPDGRGMVNREGLDFYDRLVDGLLERGLKPAATLYHWELPSALADRGGWRNRDTALRFADYAGIVADRIGDRLWSVAPINEPWCVTWLSHFHGIHAPGLRDIRATARACHHVMLAHGLTIRALRQMGIGNLGGVFNCEAAEPADPSSPADRAAAARYDEHYNRFFLQAACHGRYPGTILDGFAPHMPEDWEEDMATIAAPLDWIGLNYYTRKRIRHAPGPWPNMAEAAPTLPTTSLGWEIHPEGLHHFLTMIARDYAPGVPIYVTENGMAHGDALGRPDTERMDYLRTHLAQARRALRDGVDLRGYFIWSLLDNYEWALGYGPRFGLVHVNHDDLKRTPKASYHALRDALSH